MKKASIHPALRLSGALLLSWTTLAPLALLADASGSFSGNQLTQSYTPWYAKAAAATGPVSETLKEAGTSLVVQPGSALYMEGDSTLHQYQMRAGSLLGTAKVSALPGKDLSALEISQAVLVVPLKDFKSKESGLDSNAYKALKADQNPEIRFALSKAALKAGPTADLYSFTAQGTLSIAGQTAPVTLSASASLKDGAIRLQGVQKLKMTDFQVTPPSISLLVTSITCSNEIEIHYDVTFAADSK